MGKFTKVPQSTFEELQTNAGVLLNTFNPADPDEPADSAIICATTGGIHIVCTPTYSDYGEDVDNVPNNMMELKHLDGWDCSISTTCLGTSAELIRLSLGAADITAETGKIAPRRDVATTDFETAIWWVGDKADGGFVAVCLKNALSTGGFSLQTTKNGKGQISLTLTGHVSMSAQDVVPMEFYTMGGIKPLTVTSVAGTNTGATKITVSGYTLGTGESYVYKVGTAPENLNLGESVSTWTAWNGSSDITAQTGKIINIAVKDTNSKALAYGWTTVTAKA